MEDGRFPFQRLWSISQKKLFLTPRYPHSHKASVCEDAKVQKYIFQKSNVKSEKFENDAVFDKICKKK